MKWPLKTSLILLALICGSGFAYAAYAFVSLAWFLIPTGILAVTFFVAPILAAIPIQTSVESREKIKATLIKESKFYRGPVDKFLRTRNPREFSYLMDQRLLPRSVWILWSFAASIFIVFFHGFWGNIVWCIATFWLLILEIYFRRKEVTKGKVAREIYPDKESNM